MLRRDHLSFIGSRALLLATGVLGLVAAAPPLGATTTGPVELASTSPELTAALRATTEGDWLRLVDEALPGGSVELERVPVFTDDATIVLHTEKGEVVLPVPETVYFRGWTDDPSGGLVTLSLRENGDLRGLVTEADGYSMLVGGPSFAVASGLEVRAASRETPTGGFDCRNADLSASQPDATFDDLFSQFVGIRPQTEAAVGGASYTARIAIESDVEYYNKFGNSTDATDYVGDIFNYSSGVYDAEVDTTLLISSVSLWTGATSSDPWDQSSTICMLYQVGRYWNDNNGGVSRTITHFLSGKNTNAGVAWVGVLCNGAFNYDHQGACPGLSPQVDNYGGAYGVTAGIDANFDPDNPTVLWDVYASAHEVGHNFNSPHTHCYAGLGGNPLPVDNCYAGQCGQSGCYCGATSLPCAAGPGNQCGTIMSYCHLLSGGNGNISFTFGQGHPYGVSPGRVPSRMNDHVVSRAGSNPGCLDFVAVNEIFSDGFESGDTTAW